MATNKTYIEIDKLMSIARRSGLPIEDKARWTKISGPGGKVYLPKAKKAGTAHISGFRVESGFGVRDFDKDEMPTGKVTQELDFRAPLKEDEILENFGHLLTLLSETTKPVKAAPPSAPEAPVAEDEAVDAEPVAA